MVHLKGESLGKTDSFIQFRRDFAVHFEWVYFPVGPAESELWNWKESILKNVKSIPKIASIIAEIGANRRMVEH